MKKTFYNYVIASMFLISFIGAMTTVSAQEDNSGTKVKVKIVTEKDGKKEVIERTYNSIEEFEADESIHKEHLGDLENIHKINVTSEDGGHKIIKMQKSTSTDGKSFTMKINEDEDGNMVFIGDDGAKFELKSPQDSDSLVWVDEDGKTKTIVKKGDKTFTIKDGESEHVMKFDTDDGKKHMMVFITEDGDKSTIKISEDDDKVWISEEEGEHKIIEMNDDKKIIIVKTDGGDKDFYALRIDGEEIEDMEELKNISVTIDEDSISEDEVQITIDIVEEGDIVIEKSVKKVMVIKDVEGNYSTTVEELNDVDKVMNVWVENSIEDGVKKTVTVKIIKDENVDVSVFDMDSDDMDMKDFDLGDYKPLNLKSFSCNPNPNDGKFTLSFSASPKPLSVRIFGHTGDRIYFEKEDEFNGTYSKEINLGGTQKGTYVLQISQGGKAMNKKLLIK